jgi:DNA-binding beta-propeller fold protein YncE
MKHWWIEGTSTLLAAGAIALTGCGSSSMTAAKTPVVTPAVTQPQGVAFGGQQPVVNMSIQLYAASGGGYGSAATAVFTSPITTSGTGGFTFPTGWASNCPSPTSEVYLVGTSGDPVAGNGTPGNPNSINNPNLALMVALGPCNSLTPSTHIHMNELTTVAAVWALAPFMSGNTTSYLNVGTSFTNSTGLQLAFAAAAEVADTSLGTLPGSTMPAGGSLPGSGVVVNSIADVLEACINSDGGTANDSSACGQLFGFAPSGTGYPTDTITAAMNIALNPGRNVSQLYGVATGVSPFMPKAQPNAFTVAIQYTGGGLNAPTAIATDSSGYVWVANSGSAAVSRFDNLGNSLLGTTGTTLGGTPSGIAIDLSGNAWVTASNNDVYELDKTTGSIAGTTPFTGFDTPTGIAVDPAGYIWVVNSGNSTVSAFNSAGTALSGSPFSGAGIASPAGIAINGNANASCADCH